MARDWGRGGRGDRDREERDRFERDRYERDRYERGYAAGSREEGGDYGEYGSTYGGYGGSRGDLDRSSAGYGRGEREWREQERLRGRERLQERGPEYDELDRGYRASGREPNRDVGGRQRPLDLGDRNPSQGFTGGYGGGVSEREYGERDIGGSYATSGDRFSHDAWSGAMRGGAPRRADMGEVRGEHGDSWMGTGPRVERNFAGLGPRGYRRSDERIQEEVCEALTRSPDIDARDIDVRVHGGEVTLAGEVEDRRAKRLAEDIAERCVGVVDVHNQLHAKHGLLDRFLGHDREVARPADRADVGRASVTTTTTTGGTANRTRDRDTNV